MRHRLMVSCLTLTALGSLPTTLLAATPESTKDPVCRVAARWVEGHRNALPSTLTSLAMFDGVYRTAIYSALAPETRLLLWENHFDLILQTRALTVAQRALIIEWRSHLPTLHQSGQLSVANRQLVSQFKARARFHFSPALEARVFHTAGLGRENELILSSGLPMGRVSLFPPSCTCHLGETQPCADCIRPPANECAPTEQGCGWGGFDSCDGWCIS